MEILEKRIRLPAVIHALNQSRSQDVAVTTLTLSNVFYLVERAKGDVATADRLLKTYQTVGVNKPDAQWAFDHYNGKDFEDALQIAAAIREKCSLFMTLDASLTQKYSKKLNIQLIR